MYLRILLPYLYRELQQNGGVVDRVIFAMIGYTEEAQSKLKNFVTSGNRILKEKAFQFLYLKEDPSPSRVPGAGHLYPFYCKFYYVVFNVSSEIHLMFTSRWTTISLISTRKFLVA